MIARDKLKPLLEALTDAESKIQEAKHPFMLALEAIDLVRSELLDGHPEVVGECEGCDTLLFEGDKGHRCDDGPLLCEACSPTYGDSLTQLRECLADKDIGDDDRAEWESSIAHIEAAIGAGTLTAETKNVSAL